MAKKENSNMDVQNLKRFKRFFVSNTKGGIGKSTVSNYILPYYFYKYSAKDFDNLKVKLIELDSTNKTRSDNYKNSVIDYSFNKLNSPDEIKEIFVDSFFEDENNAIFDIGGGIDSLKAIFSLLEVESGMDDFLFILPFTISDDSLSGAIDMYENIINHSPNANVLLVANRVRYPILPNNQPEKLFLTQEDLLKQFTNAELNFQKILSLNIPFSYIPEFRKTLSENLFNSIQGSCLDFCEDLLRGTSAEDLRKIIHNRSRAEFSDKSEQKDFYLREVKKLTQKSDLFMTLSYCTPLFDKITELADKRP